MLMTFLQLEANVDQALLGGKPCTELQSNQIRDSGQQVVGLRPASMGSGHQAGEVVGNWRLEGNF